MGPLTGRKLTIEQRNKAIKMRNRRIPLPYSRIIALLHLDVHIGSLHRIVNNQDYGKKEYSGNTRLSPDIVRELRIRFKNLGYVRYQRGRYKAMEAIGRLYGVSGKQVWHIVTYRRWK